MKKILFTVFIFLALVSLCGCKSIYFQYIVKVAPDRFELKEGHERLYIPVRSSHFLDNINPDVENLFVMIHGGALNAENAFKNGKKIIESLKKSKNKTMFIAPQFLEKGAGTDEKGLLFWDQKWRAGGNSLSVGANKGLPEVSSYTVLDKLIDYIAEHNPSLRRITILGHSAGGQFVIRYAATNRQHETLEKHGINVLYAVANPSSYLYLNESRYQFRSDGTIAEFTRDELLGCPGYNNYKYGLNKLYGYAEKLSPERIREQLLSRPIIFVLGKADTERDWGLDKSCEGDAQGKNRYQRGLLYKHHLRLIIKKRALTCRQTWLEIPEVGHDSTGILSHPLFIKELKAFDEHNQ